MRYRLKIALLRLPKPSVVSFLSFIGLLETFIGILHRNLALASRRRDRRPGLLQRNLAARSAAVAAGPSSTSYRPAHPAPWTRAAATATTPDVIAAMASSSSTDLHALLHGRGPPTMQHPLPHRTWPRPWPPHPLSTCTPCSMDKGRRRRRILYRATIRSMPPLPATSSPAPHATMIAPWTRAADHAFSITDDDDLINSAVGDPCGTPVKEIAYCLRLVMVSTLPSDRLNCSRGKPGAVEVESAAG
jgi:hypothetical protein